MQNIIREAQCDKKGEHDEEDHGKDEAADEDVEDAGDVGEAQLALRRSLLLLLALGSVVPPSEHQKHCDQNRCDQKHCDQKHYDQNHRDQNHRDQTIW